MRLVLTHTSGTLVDIDGIWVEELLPERFTGAEYTFDGDGSLVKSEVNGVVTYYLGKYYEKTVQNGHTAEKKHYSAGSTIIAVRTVIDGTQDTLNWLVGDHLGSTSLVTDSAGAVVNEVRYSAFGEMRYLNGETVTDLLYTGQRLQDELGLYFYGARWYDSALGRFVQADSIVPDAGSAGAYDRYAYVSNNPIKYTDPSGHIYTWGTGGGGGNHDDDQPDVFDYPSLWIPGIGGSNINYGNPYFAEKGESEEFIEGIREGTKYELAVAGFIVGTYGASYLLSKWIMEAGATGAALGERAAAKACADGDCTNEIKTTFTTLDRVVTRISTVNPGSSDAVIGGYDGYLKWAKELGASCLDMPKIIQKVFYSNEAFWPINQLYLDNFIKKEAWFILSSPYPEEVVPTISFFQRELYYLLQNGYQYINIYGIDYMIPK